MLRGARALRFDRRRFLSAAAVLGASLATPRTGVASDRWGASDGYPGGWGSPPAFGRYPQYRVGNYSGGFEKMFPHHVIAAATAPAPLVASPVPGFRYKWGFFDKTPEEYLDQWPATALLICRNGNILYERYRFARTPDMRMTSWSMAKSVTSLLLGICLDRGLVASYDDVAEKYLPELKGTLHGGTTLRNLGNMASGAEVVHDRDNPRIYPSAYLNRDSSIARTVAGWNQRREEQGLTFNYNELCPLTIGMVIRRVTGTSMSAFAQQALWQPLGAEGAATWTTDAEKCEYNCIGFAARIRDWARLGMLVASRGRRAGAQVVSERWIDECCSWSGRDAPGRHGIARRFAGYKAFMWHARADGSRPYFNGHHGQRVIVDMPSGTVLVHTAVAHDGDWQSELFEMLDAAAKV